MKDFITHEVLNYWEKLRNGRLVPKRSEIDPRALPNTLNYTFILEAHAPDNIRFRLTGSKVCDCMGMEMRGMPAYAMINPDNRAQFNDALQLCLAQPAVLNLDMAPNTRMLLLPMTGEDGQINRLLGCLSADPNQTVFPTRFSIKSIADTRIIAASSLSPQAPLRQLAEAQTPYEPDTKKAASTLPPYLRVIK